MMYRVFLCGDWSGRDVSTEELRRLALTGELHPDDLFCVPSIDIRAVRVGTDPALMELIRQAPPPGSVPYLKLVGESGPDPDVLQLTVDVQGLPGPDLGPAMWAEVGSAASQAPPNGFFKGPRPESIVASQFGSFDGTIELRYGKSCHVVDAVWELNGMERFCERDGTVVHSASWRARVDWRIKDRVERLDAYEHLGQQGRYRRGMPDVSATMRVTASGQKLNFVAKRLTCLDAFDLCAEPDDDTTVLKGQRSEYADMTCMIEAWGFGDHVQRTWYFFLRDLKAKGAGDPLRLAESLVTPDLMPGTRAEARYGKHGLVTVNEAR
jgi:hypothetical protein